MKKFLMLFLGLSLFLGFAVVAEDFEMLEHLKSEPKQIEGKMMYLEKTGNYITEELLKNAEKQIEARKKDEQIRESRWKGTDGQELNHVLSRDMKIIDFDISDLNFYLPQAGKIVDLYSLHDPNKKRGEGTIVS